MTEPTAEPTEPRAPIVPITPSGPSGTPMIRLDKVSKHYPGQHRPAVAELSLDIAAGETVVLLGPSGCGKTTTLRLINRMTEPSSGRIFLGGEDVTRVHPDQLRRRIGYVIQQVGLFPHMTIAENVGLVPRTLGWSRERIAARVDELLDLVGLEPAAYRRRFPKQLSGGQQQRVGVARALAADPPVMLMDEPFGAVDPITRERLQDELLNLQERIRKTIVLVTHDVTEAVKLGDRIALFGENAAIAQYDTPERILAAPADKFVTAFIGSGAAMRRLRLHPVGSVDLDPVHVVRAGERPSDDEGSGRRLLVDDSGTVQGWLRPIDDPASGASRGEIAVVRSDQPVYEALDAMLRARDDMAAVLDESGAPVGVLTWAAVVRNHLAHDPAPEPPDGAPRLDPSLEPER